MTTHPSPTLFAVPRSQVADLPWDTFPAGSGVENKVLYTTGRTVAGLLRLHPDATEMTHLHLHGEHHIWVLGGEVTIDGTDLPVDSYVHVPERLDHSIRDTGQGSLLFYVFCPAESP